MNAPRYEYEVTLTVRVAGDGQHFDGDGAGATIKRLAERLRDDALVLDVVASPPRYRAKLEAGS